MVGLCNKGFLFTISLGPFQPDWRLEVGTDWEWLLLIYLTHIISFSCFSWNASSLPRRCEHCLMLFDDWNDWIRVSLSCRTWNDWPLCTHLSLSFILKNMLSEFCSPKCPPNDFTPYSNKASLLKMNYNFFLHRKVNFLQCNNVVFGFVLHLSQ